MSKKAAERLTLVQNHITPAQPATALESVKATDAAYYKYFLPFQTKWHENDMYAVYITYFDAIINEYLVKVCGVAPSSSKTPIGLVIASSIQYQAALEFPEPVIAGLAVKKLGRTSVTYAVALFKAVEQSRTSDLRSNTFNRYLKLHNGNAASTAEMTHVFVDPTTRRPVPIEGQLKEELSKLLVR